jgi:hypothetical protein
MATPVDGQMNASTSLADYVRRLAEESEDEDEDEQFLPSSPIHQTHQDILDTVEQLRMMAARDEELEYHFRATYIH